MQPQVAIYCRLSKEDEEKIKKGDDSESIQNQKLILMEYAMKQGWKMYEIYSDDDYSGLDRNRPEFRRMIDDAQKKKFNIVLCKNQSRFSRDMEVIEKYLHNLFVLWDIRFVGITDHVDTNVQGGKKSRQINGLVNEWYCEDLSENVRAALIAKKKNGKYLGYWCTYGYELDPNDKHKIIVDPIAAEIVQEIYNLYLSGYGVAAIAKILTDKKYLTPSLYKQSKGKKYYNPAQSKAGYSSKYGVWAINTIRRILRDETYLGHLIQGREKKLNYKAKKVIQQPKEDWIIVKNNHEAIINEDVFYKVQHRLGVRSANFKVNIEGMPKSHLFAGKVICLDCGNIMQKRHGKKSTLYLKCGLALKTRNDACTLHTIRMDVLVIEVKNRIQRVIETYISANENSKDLLEYLYNTDSIEKDLNKKKKSLNTLLKKQDELALGLTNVYMDKVKGNLTEQQFQIVRQNFDIETKNIEFDIEKMEGLIAETESKLSAKNVNTSKIKDHVNFTELTHEIVNDFIDYIEIGEKNSNGEQLMNVHWLF